MEERLNNKLNKRRRNTSSSAAAIATRPSIEKIVFSDAAKSGAYPTKKLNLLWKE
jgi:hypothetical protein